MTQNFTEIAVASNWPGAPTTAYLLVDEDRKIVTEAADLQEHMGRFYGALIRSIESDLKLHGFPSQGEIREPHELIFYTIAQR